MSGIKGILLCNIGTPESYSVRDVSKYLKEFLMDEEIIDIPFLVRYPLVNWLIVPKRAPFSAKNYEAVWTAEGSPLMKHSLDLQKNLQQSLGEKYQVRIGMRYGRPSIRQALESFAAEKVKEVFVVPLYPQYARATTESTLKEVRKVNNSLSLPLDISHMPAFYNSPEFIQASVEVLKRHLQDRRIDHYLMTYHGLPVRQNDQMVEGESYRHQCQKTSDLLAQALGLNKDQYSVSFQSRLGQAEWIRPYTDERLKELAQKGVKNLAVLCPSFICDCLETLEEIGVEGQKTFKEQGGQNFYLVPCLNGEAGYLTELILRV